MLGTSLKTRKLAGAIVLSPQHRHRYLQRQDWVVEYFEHATLSPELRANFVEVTWEARPSAGYTAAITCMASYHDAPGLTPQPPTPATLWAAPSCHSVSGDPA